MPNDLTLEWTKGARSQKSRCFLIQWKPKFWNLNLSIGKKCIWTNYNSSDQLAHLWLSFCLSTICFHICNVCDIVFPSLRSICLYLNWCTRTSDNFYNSSSSFFLLHFCNCLLDLIFSHLSTSYIRKWISSQYIQPYFRNTQDGTTKLETFFYILSTS